MQARGIIQNADQVRALLNGRRTQLRVPIKPQPAAHLIDCGEAWAAGFVDIECPYGQIGDLLYVRETHHLSHTNAVTYRADFERDHFSDEECGDDCSMTGESWRSSAQMPRHASRLTLRITRVWAERVQDISEADAEAEGIERFMDGHKTAGCISEFETSYAADSARQCFGHHWKSTHDNDSWNENPWVWVIEFTLIRANIDQLPRRNAA